MQVNNLNGKIELTHLPASLKTLWLHRNLFSGSIDLSSLPDGMEQLKLGMNRLCDYGGDGGVASAGLRAQSRNIDPRSRRLAGHRPDGWPSLDGGSV